MNNENQTCDKILDLLARQASGELPEQDAELLKMHLANCPDCRQVSKALGNLQTAMQTEVSGMQARPETLALLQAHFSRQADGHDKSAIPVIISNFFRQRVPLYQAALGVALLLLVLLFTQNPDTSINTQRGQDIRYVEMADSTAPGATSSGDSMSVGRSLYEDSLLIRFFHSVM